MSVNTAEPSSVASRDAESIELWLREKIASFGELNAIRVNVHKPIATYGVDSVEVAALAEDLEDWLGDDVPIDLIWEWASIRETAQRIAVHLVEERGY